MTCRGNQRQLGKLQPPERNKYYYGKLLDERNLEMEQDYFNYKRWLLNRLGLGAGILCGLQVTRRKEQLCILPGVAIDALGREIIVHEPWRFDPWLITDRCGHVKHELDKTENHEITICLGYHQCYADYAPVLVTDCNVREQCAPGTIRESFSVIILDKKPETVEIPEKLCKVLNSQAFDLSERRQLVCEVTSGACATASEDSCVILAGVTLNARDRDNPGGMIDDIKMCDYRTTLYSNERLFEMILCLAGRGNSTAGPKGDPGSKWHVGTVDPGTAVPANAAIGDCYLNTRKGDVFEKNLGGTWDIKGNILGPSGPQGIQGVQGIQGLEGKQGKQGEPGKRGEPGLGLNPNLPKILDISWQHNEPRDYLDFLGILEKSHW